MAKKRTNKKAAKKKAPKKAAKKKPAKKKAAKKAAKKKPAKKAAKKAAKKKPAKKAAKKPAKKAAPKKAAPKKAVKRASKFPKGLAGLKTEMDKGFELVRRNENSLARKIENIRHAGEGILDRMEALQGEATPGGGTPFLGRMVKAESGIRSLQEDVRELSQDTQLCNAGPVIDKLPAFEADLRALKEEVAGVRDSFAVLIDKINELAAKFNFHSHFLKAVNWNQDLLFHSDPPSAQDKDESFADEAKTLALRPARGKAPEGFAVNLKLTPPRHWEDPVIWFDNVEQVEKKE